jgi:hypothetical protein
MKTAKELSLDYSDAAKLKHLQDAMSLRRLIAGALHSDKFIPNQSLNGKIVLTGEGEEALRFVKEFHSDKPELWAQMVVFLSFYNEDLLIDLERSDLDSIRLFASACVRTRSLQYPWIFDGILYDRAAPLGINDDATLDAGASMALLADTPQGVFQVGSFVTGPFGIIESLDCRNWEPTSTFVAAYCEDPSCDEAHTATLTQQNYDLDNAVEELDDTLQELRECSDWWAFYGDMMQPSKAYYDDYSTVQLPLFLGGSFSCRELKIILKAIFRQFSSSIRGALERSGTSVDLRQSNEELVASLTKAEALQLLLVARDGDIVAAADALIQSGEIKIPTTEVRECFFGPPMRGWFRVEMECSDLGFRVVPVTRRIAMARLKRLILSIYSQASDSEQLEWLLQDTVGNDIGAQVENFITFSSPDSVLEQLVISDIRKLRATFKNLHVEHYKLPGGREQRLRLVDHLLWKLGFPKTTFSSPLSPLYDRLKKFQDAAAADFSNRSLWEENVRSAGVNLFVSLEEVLDSSLAFCAWILLSDHISDSHIFNQTQARKLMANELNGVLEIDNEPVIYDENRRNTLFPLVHGFSALSKRVVALIGEGSDKYKKDPSTLPLFINISDLQTFPYRHTRFMFDAPRAELDRMIRMLGDVTARLELSRAVTIRNRIDHHSESFPAPDDIATCCEVLRRVIEEMETGGLVPVVFSTVKREHDSYGRICIESRCYSGRAINWISSAQLEVVQSSPPISDQQILVPSLHLPGTAEILRFNIEEESDYTDLNSRYLHRRRNITVLEEPEVKSSHAVQDE